MLWRRSAHAPLAPTVAPVPDAESVRRLLLHASWRRDRAVARRRLALRWLLWALQRYGLYVLLAGSMVLAVAYWSNPNTGRTWPWQSLWRPAAPLANTAPPDAAPTTPPDAASGEQADTDPSVHLRLEPQWHAPDSSGPRPAERDEAGNDTSPPQLKPENWLHSKEP